MSAETDTAEILSPEIKNRVESELKELLEGARIEKIINRGQYDASGEMLRTVVGKRKEFEGIRLEVVGPFNESVKIINDFFRPAKEKLEGLEKNIKNALNQWELEEEARQLEDRRKMEEKQARERAKALSKAEAMEGTAEELRKNAAELRQAAQALKGDERLAALTQAAKMEARADSLSVRATDKVVEAQSIVAPVNVGEPVKVDGQSKREKWVAEITDEAQFKVWACQSGQLGLLSINEIALRKTVEAQKDGFKAPGVRVRKEFIRMVRA